ncbi:MAG: ABC transporter ATP-binding protein [Rhodothermales bacterium]|nr:ABC transporter ATP-binding protein [Rhodothermales bacterium]
MLSVTVENVTVVRGGNRILNSVSMQTSAGEAIALIGPNGAGKTTLLRTIAGHQPYTGSISVAGKELHQWKPRELAQQLSFVRQALPISFDFSVMEMILLGRAPYKSLLQTYDTADRDLVERLTDELDLGGLGNRSILDLSGGEQQRVLLAQALAQETDIILLDEPTTHLDIHHKYDFMSRVKSYAQQGKTIIAAIHDLQLASQFADRIIVLSAGNVVASGTPTEIVRTELISDVFRVNINVETDPEGDIQIHYKL